MRSNLPLVQAIASRMGPLQALPHEDLCQIASIGLLRAIEAFRPELGRSLSSFAVPYIRGAIQHELRDHSTLMRVPRDLWDLRRRAIQVQEQRQRRGGPGLGTEQLAHAVGCEPARVVEALSLTAVTEMRSLDAPLPGPDDGPARTLLDELADPASLVPPLSDAMDSRAGGCPFPLPSSWLPGDGQGAGAAGDDPGSGWSAAQLAWARRCFSQLEPLQRRLVLGHLYTNCTWVELGREVGLHPRQAQRLTVGALRRLREEGQRWHVSRSQAGGPAAGS